MEIKNDNQNNVENDLLSFSWENDDDVFFGIGAEEEPTNNEVLEEDTDDKEDAEELKKENPSLNEEVGEADGIEEEDTDSFFNEAEAQNKELLEKLSGGKEDNSLYLDLFKDLKETGVFKHVELEEGTELDFETFMDLQQKEIEANVQERLVSWAEEDLDEDAKAFIKFKLEGGDTREFFKVLENTSDTLTGDITDEKYQDKVIRYQLSKEGWSDEEIEDTLDYWTETGKKESVAKRYNKKIEKERKKQVDLAIQKEAEAREAAKQQENKFKTNLKETLKDLKDIKGFKVSQKEKDVIYNMLTKRDQKIGDGQYITGFQKKFAEAVQDPNKLILLTKLLTSDFDMSDIEKQISTKKTRQIKSNLEKRQSLRPSGSGGSSQGIHVADLFN